MSEEKCEVLDLLAAIKDRTKPAKRIFKEEKGPELDCSKWVARVNNGWDIAVKILQERDWNYEKGVDEIIPPPNFDEFYLATALFTQPKWVQVDKNLIYDRADLITQLKKLVFLIEKSVEDGVIVYGPDTDLARSWPNYVIHEAYKIGHMLSHNPTLRRLAGYSVKEGPRDSTAERRKTVTILWPMRYKQVRTARKRYTANKKDNWKEIVTKADPQLPSWLIDELPRESKQEPKELTARWLAEDLRSTPSAILEDVKFLKKSRAL